MSVESLTSDLRRKFEISTSAWPPDSSAMRDSRAASDASRTMRGPSERWPWHADVPALFDPGPGSRSGEGSASLLPFLATSLAGKLEPERRADLFDF